MPKMKTHKGTAKRFRRTGSGKIMRAKAFKSHILTKKSPKRISGKIMRAKAFKSHILTKKSPKRIRGFRQETVISPADVKTVSQRMGSN